MEECCGKQVKTKFCPDCGRPSSLKPGLTLLHHCRTQVLINERRKKRREQYAGEGQVVVRSLQKWMDWVAFLEEVLKESP